MTRLMSAAMAINNSVQSRGAGVLMAQAALQPLAATGALDVDGNGKYDALTDGVLTLRWLFGLSGSTLVNNAIGSGAQRSLPADVTAWLEAHRAAFDVDDNKNSDALTDGLMILRYMFGLRGAALVNGAIGSGANRATSAAIESYMSGLIP